MAGGLVRASELASDRARALQLAPVSRETADRLDRFVSLLLKWQQTTNLIAPSTLNQVWTRHIADSLQLLAIAPDAHTWVDFGSGGGFPGVVIACALAGTSDCAIHLIESNNKKAGFLREATRQLDIPALVHVQRIEAFVERFSDPVDVVTARALAPLTELLDHAEPLLKRGAQALFLKGQDVEAELTDASRYWIIDAKLVPSLTRAQSQVVVIGKAERR